MSTLICHIEAKTEKELRATVRNQAKREEWYILQYQGYKFKIYKLWLQIVMNPAGFQDYQSSPTIFVKTQKGLIDLINKAIVHD